MKFEQPATNGAAEAKEGYKPKRAGRFTTLLAAVGALGATYSETPAQAQDVNLESPTASAEAPQENTGQELKAFFEKEGLSLPDKGYAIEYASIGLDEINKLEKQILRLRIRVESSLEYINYLEEGIQRYNESIKANPESFYLYKDVINASEKKIKELQDEILANVELIREQHERARHIAEALDPIKGTAGFPSDFEFYRPDEGSKKFLEPSTEDSQETEEPASTGRIRGLGDIENIERWADEVEEVLGNLIETLEGVDSKLKEAREAVKGDR